MSEYGWFILVGGLACIVWGVIGWAHGRAFGFRRHRWWPFLGLVCALLLCRELLPGPAPVSAAISSSAEDRIRRSAWEIADENLRIADELNRRLKEVKATWPHPAKRN